MFIRLFVYRKPQAHENIPLNINMVKGVFFYAKKAQQVLPQEETDYR